MRFRGVLGGVLAGLLVATGASAPGAEPADAATGDFWIVGGDQGANQLIAFDPAVTDWNTSTAVKWSWTPTTARGFSSSEISGLTLLSDFKLRNRAAPATGQRFVVTGANFAAIADYPSGNRVWAKVISGDNIHSAELLPDGNIAIAASDGGWIRVYAASQGSTAATYAQYNLAFAHAALWDTSIQRLWVIGQDPTTSAHILTALRVGGTPAQPVLAEDTSRRATLPSPWGHDVSPYLHDAGKLWVTTNAGVYLFDKATRTFTSPSSGNRSAVKAIGNQPSGQLVETTPDNTRCTLNAWCTDTVDFFAPAATRRRTGAAFYKARPWQPYYNLVDDTWRGPVWGRVRDAAGAWGDATEIDGNPAASRVAAVALPDGSVHVQTLVPFSGVWDRTRYPDGTWSAATKIDANTKITAIASVALPDGTVHVQTVVPGSGVWDRTRTAAGTWTSSTQIDQNGSVTAVSSAGLPDGTVHVQTLLPGSGVWDRTRTAAGTWTSSTKIDTNGYTSAIAAAALPDGTLHVTTVDPGYGATDRTRTSSGAWSSATSVDGNGSLLDLAVTGSPDGTLTVCTVPDIA